MQTGEGILTQIRLEGGASAGRILCPRGMIPRAGQYLLASLPGDLLTPFPVPLFPAGDVDEDGWLAAPPLPGHWQPGERLLLRGPLGSGFNLPSTARRVALAALGPSPARLLPLADQALKQGAAVALYTDAVPTGLSPALEVSPLSALPEVLDWADAFAVDLPLERLQTLRSVLKMTDGGLPGITAQALLSVPMPCGGAGECGACAVHTRTGYALACKDGPVFDLNRLEDAL
ncbi:MAG: hypothetical protein ABFD44_08800 [Anaerolineaceae bacterium]